MRRRRVGRKSSSVMSKAQQIPLAEEVATPATHAVPTAPSEPTITPAERAIQERESAEEKERQLREEWCNSVYIHVLRADQNQWKMKIYSHAFHAEESRQKRLHLELQIANDLAATEVRKEKERQNEKRVKKMERMMSRRGEGRMENGVSLSGDDNAADDQSVISNVDPLASSLKKMRNRRRKAAKKKSSA